MLSEHFRTRENRENHEFLRFSFSQVSEIAVFQKLGSEQVFRAFYELVPTRENSFRLETRLESLDKSSERRALICTQGYKGHNPWHNV